MTPILGLDLGEYKSLACPDDPATVEALSRSDGSHRTPEAGPEVSSVGL
jgi:hypothetical protein